MRNLRSTLLGLFLICGGCVSAQTSNPVNVTIQLAGTGPSITVNNSLVDLNFSTTDNYVNGVHSGSVTNDHITVSSNTGFQVNVKGSGDLVNGSNSIPLGTITITPSDGSQTISPAPAYTATSGGLSTSSQTIITSASGTTSAKFNIDYYARGGSDYVGKPAGTYSATITYSIVPD